MANIFGVIYSVPAAVGSDVFIMVLVVLIILEYCFQTLDELAKRNGYEKVFEKLKNELNICTNI